MSLVLSFSFIYMFYVFSIHLYVVFYEIKCLLIYYTVFIYTAAFRILLYKIKYTDRKAPSAEAALHELLEGRCPSVHQDHSLPHLSLTKSQFSKELQSSYFTPVPCQWFVVVVVIVLLRATPAAYGSSQASG